VQNLHLIEIPPVKHRQSGKCVPRWSEHMQPLRDKSLFWHRLWINWERPRSGAVADCMRRSRAAYHYAVKRVKKDKEVIVRERKASAILEGDDRNFWAEIKRMRGNKAGTCKIVDSTIICRQIS
jgi:hypothetical protein